jgi:hypothetical protein
MLTTAPDAPWWLEHPDFLKELSDDDADKAGVKPLRDLVRAHHPELMDVWRSLVRRNFTNLRERGAAVGDYMIGAAARFAIEPNADAHELQEDAFFALVMVALWAHERGVRVEIVGERDPQTVDFEADLIWVGRIAVPAGVDRGAFTRAMGTLALTVAAAVYAFRGEPQPGACVRLVGLVTGVTLTRSQARHLVQRKLAATVAAMSNDYDRLAKIRDDAAKLVAELSAWAVELGLEPPPPPPPDSETEESAELTTAE